MKNDPKKTSALLQSGQMGLSQLLSRIKEWDAINQKIGTFFEPAVWRYCRLGSFNQNELVILAANASIATQIRFQSADILKKFAVDPALKQIQSIHCKVIPSFAYSSNKVAAKGINKNIPPLSQPTAHMLEEIAKSIEDPKLREVMLKIASHTKK